jgi:hypothetical protein
MVFALMAPRMYDNLSFCVLNEIGVPDSLESEQLARINVVVRIKKKFFIVI